MAALLLGQNAATHLVQLPRRAPQQVALAIGFGQAAGELRAIHDHAESIPRR
jgi:hypothetical protein